MSAERDMQLHIAADGPRLVGHVEAPDGSKHAFSSWLGLLSVLEMLADPGTGEDWRPAHDPF